MLYLNTSDIQKVGIQWQELIQVIRSSAKAMAANDFFQPIKPYLRYKDLSNRIIAMPAYVGADVSMAGIKWIASFPGNLKRGIPRAHSVTILNEADTGIPVCALNTPLVSGIRTAAVTGAVVTSYLEATAIKKKLNIGISGFGPIGKLHLGMIASVLGDRLGSISLYDIRGIEEREIPEQFRSQTTVCKRWNDCYADSDIFITCTVSSGRYINEQPKPGSLQLNISLRDYMPEYRDWVDLMIVDNWEEVCRENTDIEAMHKLSLLNKADTISLSDLLAGNFDVPGKRGAVWMFNPMGMAAFDIAIGAFYYKKSVEQGVGVLLQD
jgi:N-[(2S)-2-amino-2-carboxyethyl]-L-glutamate dehydrogenase